MSTAVAVRSQVGGAPRRASGASALIGYLPVGYPTVDGSVEAVRTMIDAGADVVELGVPYSDPVHGRPDRSSARSTRALAGGTRVRRHASARSSRWPDAARPSSS